MTAFGAAVETRDIDAMERALHPDLVFSSPAVFTPYEGRDAVLQGRTEIVARMGAALANR